MSLYPFAAWLVNAFRVTVFLGVFMVIAKLIGWPLTLLFGAPLGVTLSAIVIIIAIAGAMTCDQHFRAHYEMTSVWLWAQTA